MEAFELLKKWPGWGNANAEKVLASPAWKLDAEYNGSYMEIRKIAFLPDLLWIDILLDDVPHALGIADSKSYGDLHLLWEKRNGLPAEVLLALVEKECGELFQTLENAARKSLEVKGVSTAAVDAEKTAAFGIFDSGSLVVAFALTLSPALTMAWGQLKYIDTAHPDILSLQTEASPFYSSVELPDGDGGNVHVGDFLLLSGEDPKWLTEFTPVEGFAVIGAETGWLSFAQLTGGELPPVPAPEKLRLVKGGAFVAEGILSNLVGNAVMSVTETANEG